jgi:hypothetical protein
MYYDGGAFLIPNYSASALMTRWQLAQLVDRFHETDQLPCRVFGSPARSSRTRHMIRISETLD